MLALDGGDYISIVYGHSSNYNSLALNFFSSPNNFFYAPERTQVL